jgi:hypothetical protein
MSKATTTTKRKKVVKKRVNKYLPKNTWTREGTYTDFYHLCMLYAHTFDNAAIADTRAFSTKTLTRVRKMIELSGRELVPSIDTLHMHINRDRLKAWKRSKSTEQLAYQFTPKYVKARKLILNAVTK